MSQKLSFLIGKMGIMLSSALILHTHTHTPLALCLARISIPGSLLIFNHWKITKPSYLNSNGCYSLKGSKDEQFNGGCKLRFIFHGLIYRTPFHCKSGHKASSPCLAFICLITLVKSFYLFVYFLNWSIADVWYYMLQVYNIVIHHF